MSKRILITGITGTVGRAVLDRISTGTDVGGKKIRRGWLVAGIASGETRIKDLEKIYRDPDTTIPSQQLRLYAADISDPATLHACVAEADMVLHTAAKKHVDFVQRSPLGAFAVNTSATLGLAEACRMHGKKLVFMSTDKAVEPGTFYGWTKNIAEQIVLGDDHRAPGGMAGTVVRSGNILASSGSIFTIWHREARQGFISMFGEGHLRYVVEREELAGTLLAAAQENWGGRIVIPARMQLWNMDVLAKSVAQMLGLPIKHVHREKIKAGIPEKTEEFLYTAGESKAGRVFLWDNNKGLVKAPQSRKWNVTRPDPDVIRRIWEQTGKEAAKS